MLWMNENYFIYPIKKYVHFWKIEHITVLNWVKTDLLKFQKKSNSPISEQCLGGSVHKIIYFNSPVSPKDQWTTFKTPVRLILTGWSGVSCNLTLFGGTGTIMMDWINFVPF